MSTTPHPDDCMRHSWYGDDGPCPECEKPEPNAFKVLELRNSKKGLLKRGLVLLCEYWELMSSDSDEEFKTTVKMIVEMLEENQALLCEVRNEDRELVEQLKALYA